MITYEQTLAAIDKEYTAIKNKWKYRLRGGEITTDDIEAFTADMSRHTAAAEWNAIESAAALHKLIEENEQLKATIIVYGCDQIYTPEMVQEMQQNNSMAIPAWLTDYIDYERLQKDVSTKKIRYV